MARIRQSFALELLEGRKIPSIMTVTNPAEYATASTEEPAPPQYGTAPVAFPPSYAGPSFPA